MSVFAINNSGPCLEDYKPLVESILYGVPPGTRREGYQEIFLTNIETVIESCSNKYLHQQWIKWLCVMWKGLLEVTKTQKMMTQLCCSLQLCWASLSALHFAFTDSNSFGSVSLFSAKSMERCKFASTQCEWRDYHDAKDVNLHFYVKCVNWKYSIWAKSYELNLVLAYSVSFPAAGLIKDYLILLA